MCIIGFSNAVTTPVHQELSIAFVMVNRQGGHSGLLHPSYSRDRNEKINRARVRVAHARLYKNRDSRYGDSRAGPEISRTCNGYYHVSLST